MYQQCVANGYNGADPPNIAYWEVGYMGAACLNQQNNCGQAYADVRHVETRVHPDYDWWTNSIYPDMALVRLATPVTFIDPVEIDTGTYVRYGGDESNLRGLRFTVIGAGSNAAFDLAKPALDAVAATVYHLSETPGQGSAMKTVNQLLKAA